MRPELGPMVVRQVGELFDCKRVVSEPSCDLLLGGLGDQRVEVEG